MKFNKTSDRLDNDLLTFLSDAPKFVYRNFFFIIVHKQNEHRHQYVSIWFFFCTFYTLFDFYKKNKNHNKSVNVYDDYYAEVYRNYNLVLPRSVFSSRRGFVLSGRRGSREFEIKAKIKKTSRTGRKSLRQRTSEFFVFIEIITYRPRLIYQQSVC